MISISYISEAYAQTTAVQQSTAELLNTVLMFGLIFLVFYLLVIRPQQKKVKQHREMLSAIRRGDRVVTGGGIIGLVSKVVSEHEVVVEITDDIRVRVVRNTIASIMAKTEPVSSKVKIVAEENVTNSNFGVADHGGVRGNFSILIKRLLGSRDK